MALAKGTNSYVTVAEADTYFSDRLLSSSWAGIADADKEKALVSATDLIDSKAYLGTSISTLAFPRNGYYLDPVSGSYASMDPVPNRVIDAVCLLALHLSQNPEVLSETGGVKSLKVGSISLDLIKEKRVIPGIVTTLLRPLMDKTSRNWFRSN